MFFLTVKSSCRCGLTVPSVFKTATWTLFMPRLSSSLQISMSVQMALLSVTANPLVSTCPAGTTASAAMATMTTACFPPMGNRV